MKGLGVFYSRLGGILVLSRVTSELKIRRYLGRFQTKGSVYIRKELNSLTRLVWYTNMAAV